MLDSLDTRKGKSFPQNEQAWIEMAAGFGKPLMAKTKSEIAQLDGVRSEASAFVAAEKKKAYETAAKLAVTENYDTYDKFAGKTIIKGGGAAAASGSAAAASSAATAVASASAASA